MLRRLLLKNWNDSATCAGSTYSTWLRNAAFGVPSFAQVNNIAGTRPWKHGGELFEAEAHVSTAPASGPGVELNIAVTRILTALQGQTFHVAVARPGIPTDVELAQEAFPLRHDELLLGRLGIADIDEDAFHLDGAFVRRPRERQRGLAVLAQIVEDGGRGRRRHVRHHLAALVLHPHRGHAAAVRLEPGVPGADVDGEPRFEELGQGFVEHVIRVKRREKRLKTVSIAV